MIKTTQEATQAYLQVIGNRGNARGRALFAVADELLAYRSARRELNGPALADWTEQYEQTLKRLVSLTMESLNDLKDSGSLPRIVRLLSANPKASKAEDLVAQARTSIAQDFGEPAGASFDVVNPLLAGLMAETEASTDGVRVTVRRQAQEALMFGLTSQRKTGDIARMTTAAVLGARPALAVQRKTLLSQQTSAGVGLNTVDFYGDAVRMLGWLLENARREVRSAQRYGRARAQGEAPIIVAIIVAALILGLTAGYVIACTGVINPDNASNQKSDACNVVGAFVLIAWIVVLIVGSGAAVQGSGASGVTDYNLNPPAN